MRSKLAKAVRSTFTKCLTSELPQFRLATGFPVPSGCRLYEWRLDQTITCYLMLEVPSRMFNDRFTVEGIVTEGDFPPLTAPLSMKPLLEKRRWFSFRIPFLWLTGSHSDRWWEICPGMDLSNPFAPEEPIEVGLQRVAPQVDDAIEKIKQYVVPFFESFRDKGKL